MKDVRLFSHCSLKMVPGTARRSLSIGTSLLRQTLPYSTTRAKNTWRLRRKNISRNSFLCRREIRRLSNMPDVGRCSKDYLAWLAKCSELAWVSSPELTRPREESFPALVCTMSLLCSFRLDLHRWKLYKPQHGIRRNFLASWIHSVQLRRGKLPTLCCSKRIHLQTFKILVELRP